MTSPLPPVEWPDAPPTAPADSPLLPPPGVAVPSTPSTREAPRSAPREGPSGHQIGGTVRPGHGLRDGVALVLVAVGAAVLALANAAVWVDETANDRATYDDAHLLDLDGGLSGLVRERLSDALMEWAAVPERVDAALPGPLSLLGGPAESLTRRVVEEAIGATLALPEIDALIERIEATADDELVELLFDESDWLRLDGTTVVLDLDPLVLEATYQIDRFIPDWAADAVPALNASQLIPDRIDGGGLELALGEVPTVIQARSDLDVLADAAPRFLLVGGGLVVAGLLVARRRAMVLVGGGLALAISALVVSTGWPIESVFGGDVRLLQDIAGTSFVSANGEALRDRSLPLLGVGLAVAAAGGLVLTLWRPSPPRLGA